MGMGENLTFTGLKPSEIEDILRGLLETQLGFGAARATFPLRGDKHRVAKIELITRNHSGAGSSQNWVEWEVWDQIKDMKCARWFAPVHAISPAGLVLIQARTTPVTRAELPRRVPAFFWDTKIANWGRYKGRVVCHDYGRIDIGVGLHTTKKKTAKWWGDWSS